MFQSASKILNIKVKILGMWHFKVGWLWLSNKYSLNFSQVFFLLEINYNGKIDNAILLKTIHNFIEFLELDFKILTDVRRLCIPSCLWTLHPKKKPES